MLTPVLAVTQQNIAASDPIEHEFVKFLKGMRDMWLRDGSKFLGRNFIFLLASLYEMKKTRSNHNCLNISSFIK